MDLLAVQLIQDNHPLPLWNIPVYSGAEGSGEIRIH
jgi:hypothetical protein